jgi:hypothetical protein
VNRPVASVAPSPFSCSLSPAPCSLIHRDRPAVIHLLGFLLASLGLVQSGLAQPPVIQKILPVGVRPGEPVELTLTGSNFVEGGRLWTSFTAEPVGHVDGHPDRFSLEVPAETGQGFHAVRVVTGEGAGRLFPVLVDALPAVRCEETNTRIDAPQEIELPLAVDGHVGNLSRRFFRFSARSGERIAFEAWARRLGSPLDAALFLYDENGRPLHYVDDVPGIGSDPQMTYIFENSGEYLLELRDIRHQGGANHFFRLRIGDFPLVHAVVPMRNDESRVAGSDVEELDALAVSPDPMREGISRFIARRDAGNAATFGFIRAGGLPVISEAEPNGTAGEATPAEPGSLLTGFFQQPGEIDLFRFRADKNDRFRLTGITREHGLPTALVIRVLDEDGKELAHVDDSGGTAGTLEATIPEAGEYLIELSDLHRRGGSEFGYLVEFVPRTPAFTLRAGTDAVNVPAGGVAVVTVEARRLGYSGPIELSVEGLPEGLTALPTVLGSGVNQARLTIQADEDVSAGELHAIRIVGRGAEEKKEGGEEGTDVDTKPSALGLTAGLVAEATVTESLRSAWNGVSFLPGPFEDALVAAVAPASPLTLAVDPRQFDLPRTGKVTVTVSARRGEGIEEAIQLATDPERNPLPGGLAVSVKNIDKGKNEAELEISATDKAPLGPFTLVLLGSHRKGNVTTTAPTPGITFTVLEE